VVGINPGQFYIRPLCKFLNWNEEPATNGEVKKVGPGTMKVQVGYENKSITCRCFEK